MVQVLDQNLGLNKDQHLDLDLDILHILILILLLLPIIPIVLDQSHVTDTTKRMIQGLVLEIVHVQGQNHIVRS